MNNRTAVGNNSEDFRVVTLKSRCTYHRPKFGGEKCECTSSWTTQTNVSPKL